MHTSTAQTMHCLHVNSTNCIFELQIQGVRAEPAETAHFLLALYVKLLELEFVFGFFRNKRISNDSGPDQEK